MDHSSPHYLGLNHRTDLRWEKVNQFTCKGFVGVFSPDSCFLHHPRTKSGYTRKTELNPATQEEQLNPATQEKQLNPATQKCDRQHNLKPVSCGYKRPSVKQHYEL